MKNTVLILSLLLIVPLIAAADNAATKSQKTTGQVLEIGVKGMSCEFCVAKMTSNLGKLPGVAKVDVSLKLERARVVMKSGKMADVERIKKTIVDTGFTPGAVKAATKRQSRY
jgi:periplasmic mercuric ion binding protein